MVMVVGARRGEFLGAPPTAGRPREPTYRPYCTPWQSVLTRLYLSRGKADFVYSYPSVIRIGGKTLGEKLSWGLQFIDSRDCCSCFFFRRFGRLKDEAEDEEVHFSFGIFAHTNNLSIDADAAIIGP